MWKARSVIHGATVLSLVLGGCLTLSGCGSDAAGTSGQSHPPTTEEEKAKDQAVRKASEDAHKDYEKSQKKKSNTPKGRRMANGQQTS